MTQIDGPTRRRRFSWSARGQGNRIFYALFIGWLAWMALAQPATWMILVVAAAVWAIETAFFLVRDAYAGTERQL